MGTGAFEQLFSELEDPRQSAKVAHLFTDILFLVVCSSIAGARGWEDIEDFGDLHFNWFREKGLKTIGVTLSYRQPKNGKASLEYRYYISSAALTKARFANAVRSHWAVENSLHWVLDVSMKEDECQIYRGNAAEILSGARKLALNMLRAKTTRKVRVPRKQKRAHGSTDYLERF